MTPKTLLLVGALLLSTSEEKTLEEARRRLPAIVPHWYLQRTPLRCLSHCKTLAGSDFRFEAYDTHAKEEVEVTVVCDDIPDEHQCGYLVRPLVKNQTGR